jgi:hypothetical protein
MKGKDKIPGGLTDKLTIADVAKKHKMTVAEIQKELDAGIKVEMEHTDSKEKAEEIALDHLLELSDYYKRLDKMEKDAEKEGVNENITAYARRMRELAGLADGNQHKTLKTVQEGESSFEGGATFYAKDMTKIVNESINESMSTTDQLKVGQVYSYNSGVMGQSPYKIKVVDIKDNDTFSAEIAEESEATKYNNWKLGQRLSGFRPQDVVETGSKEMSPLNQVVEPKNYGVTDEKALEMFEYVKDLFLNKNKMNSVSQEANAFSDNDIAIQTHQGNTPVISIMAHKSKKDIVLKVLNDIASKTGAEKITQGEHVAEERNAISYALFFPKTQQVSEGAALGESKDEFETHKFEQRAIEEGADDKELYNLNENTIIVLDFLDEDSE